MSKSIIFGFTVRFSKKGIYLWVRFLSFQSSSGFADVWLVADVARVLCWFAYEHLCGNPIPSSRPAAQSDSRGRSWAPTGVPPPLLPAALTPCFPPLVEGNTLSAPWRTQHILALPPPLPMPPPSPASEPLERELCKQPIVTELLVWCQASTPFLRGWWPFRWSVPLARFRQAR